MRYTAKGTYQGRTVSITWHDGDISGGPEAVAALRKLDDDLTGKPLELNDYHYSLYSHLRAPLAAQWSMQKVLKVVEWEGELPEVPDGV